MQFNASPLSPPSCARLRVSFGRISGNFPPSFLCPLGSIRLCRRFALSHKPPTSLTPPPAAATTAAATTAAATASLGSLSYRCLLLHSPPSPPRVSLPISALGPPFTSPLRMLGASRGPAPRPMVRMYDGTQQWAWNPYVGGLGCSSMLGAPPPTEAPKDIEGLREMYRNEVSALTMEHELLLFDLERFQDMSALYRDSEGGFLLSPPPDLLEIKKGLDLRIEQFKDDCGRSERLQRRLQRQIDKGPPLGGGPLGGPTAMSPEAVAANCLLIKRVRDQKRLISMLQRDLEERLYEQSLMETHLKKLRRAADHLSISVPPRGPLRGPPEPPPTLHQREKKVPEFKADWLQQIRFPLQPIPRAPTRQPPIPAATVRESKKAAAAAAAAKGDMGRRISKKERKPSAADAAAALGSPAEAAEEEGLLPRMLRSFWGGREETPAAAAAAAPSPSRSASLQRFLSGGMNLVVTGTPGMTEKETGRDRAEKGPRSPRSPLPGRPQAPPLTRGDSRASSLVRGASRTLMSPRSPRGEGPLIRQGSRTLASPRGPPEETEEREDAASVSRSPSRQPSRTLMSPRGVAAAAVDTWAAAPSSKAAAAGIARKESRTLMSPRGSTSLERKGSRTLLSPRVSEGALGGPLQRGASVAGSILSRKESAAFLS